MFVCLCMCVGVGINCGCGDVCVCMCVSVNGRGSTGTFGLKYGSPEVQPNNFYRIKFFFHCRHI